MQTTGLEQAEDCLTKATALWFQGRPHQALGLYADAVAALPPDAAAHIKARVKSEYALCLRAVGQVDAALAIYQELDALCSDAGLDATDILRQWAIAWELKGDFGRARRLYERITPGAETPRQDRLKWQHAMGLLNWSEGRLTEAATNLAAATAEMATDPEEAANQLAVLGNDALLSLYLGNTARAYRLADRMMEIRQAVEFIPLASAANLATLRAALAQRRGDHAQEAQILKDAVDWLTQHDPDEWMQKLDLVGQFAAAAQRAGQGEAALPYLAELCDAVPVEMAWVGDLMLSQLQVELGDCDGAKRSATRLLASEIAKGTPERETEIVAVLAGLAHLAERTDAAIFLGKLALKYLVQLIQSLSTEEARHAIAQSHQLLGQTITHLRSAGRFHEAVVLDDLFARVRRAALLLQKPALQVLEFQPIPFDRAERQAEADWMRWRQELAALREVGDPDPGLQRSGQVIGALLDFTTTSGLAHRETLLPPPDPGCLRISFIPAGDGCELQYQWPDRILNVRIALSPAAFFDAIATLREAVADPAAWRHPAAMLYRHILGPVAGDLDGLDYLEIDASGALGRIPIGLLSDGATCLAQRVAIRYVIAANPVTPAASSRHGLAHCAALPSGVLTDSPSALSPVHTANGPDFTRAAMLTLLKDRPACLSIATHLETMIAQPDLSSLMLGDETPLYLADLAGDQFDLNGLHVAVFATCSSGFDDTTAEKDNSLAALVLEKGAVHFVGTLWDISETAAAAFVSAFWQAFAADPLQDPAIVVAALQAELAARAQGPARAASRTGGIGSAPKTPPPADWAAFAVFGNCNHPQPAAQQPQGRSDIQGGPNKDNSRE